MPDGIAKGVGEQIGGLAKQIVTEAVKAPVTLVGLGDAREGASGGGKQNFKKNQTQKPTNTNQQGNENTNTDELARQKEIDRQQQLVQARRLLQQWGEPDRQQQPSEYEQRMMEEEEKNKQMLEQQKKQAMANLPRMSSKPKRGNLYAQQTGSETKLNVKAQ